MRPAFLALLVLAGCGAASSPGAARHGSGSGSSGTTTAGLHPIGATSGGAGATAGAASGTTGGGSTSGGASTGATASGASGSSVSTGATTGGPTSGGSASTGSTSTSGSATTGGSTGGTSTTGGSTTGGSGAAPGAACSADADCASRLCKPVLLGGGAVCVTPCAAQADCAAAGAGFYCAPVAAGASSGYCVPPSAAHCAGCITDADCGPLADVCSATPSDPAASCHVDCALAGSAACPADYACTSVTVNGAARQLCVPSGSTCAGALGGFCDRVPGPLGCAQADASGSCTGQRTCDASSGRFSTCSAAAPQCRPTCGSPSDPGCTEQACASATTTATDCGACGNACPGAGQATAVVTCASGTTCTFACSGANYDSNADPADGCEAPDPTDDHTQATAVELGNSDCNDSSGIPPNGAGPSGVVASDARTHTPAITGFVASVGAAPDWFHTFNTGGTFCVDDLGVTLTVSGSASPTCYRLTVKTDKNTWQVNTNTSGIATVSASSGSYSDGSDIYLAAEKVCSTAQTERVTYTITGHF